MNCMFNNKQIIMLVILFGVILLNHPSLAFDENYYIPKDVIEGYYNSACKEIKSEYYVSAYVKLHFVHITLTHNNWKNIEDKSFKPKLENLINELGKIVYTNFDRGMSQTARRKGEYSGGKGDDLRLPESLPIK
jgi:hypothetical protein